MSALTPALKGASRAVDIARSVVWLSYQPAVGTYALVAETLNEISPAHPVEAVQKISGGAVYNVEGLLGLATALTDANAMTTDSDPLERLARWLDARAEARELARVDEVVARRPEQRFTSSRTTQGSGRPTAVHN